MEAPGAPSRHCYSVRLLRPFATLLQRYPGFPTELMAPLEAMDPDERIPIPVALELLRGAVAISGDQDIGLKAAREPAVGDFGALEYAAASAPNVREAFAVIARYMGLLNDALETTLEIEGDQATVRLHSAIVLSRAANDFQSAAFFVAVTGRHAALEVEPEGEVLFTHDAPADTREYLRTFPGRTLRFSAPFNGFRMHARIFDRSLGTADAKLHDLIRRHADMLMAELPKAHSFTESVRSLIASQLSGGDPSAANIAKRMHMSSRTLARRLEEEGTSFKDLVDDLRRRMALRYVGGQDLDISEIAFLLGFSETSAFYRAFKRWTSETPLTYRRARRG